LNYSFYHYIIDAPKLAQINEEDNLLYSHKSKPVILAAKEAHKNMLRKQRAKWYELLMDDSDTDEDDIYDENFDELTNNIRNLNFNSNTDNFYAETGRKKYEPSSSNPTLLLHKSVTKKDKNQLKTNSLRKSITKMMNLTPSKSTIWNVEPLPSKKAPRLDN